MKQASLFLLGLAANASAVILKTGDYSLTFGTSAANSNPYATDSIGGHNITNGQATTVSAATGSVAPDGGGGITITGAVPNGIFGNAVNYNYSSDWGVSIWVRANGNTGGAFFQGENANTGGYLGRNSNGTFDFGGIVNANNPAYTAAVGTWYMLSMINYGGQMTYFIGQTRVATGVSTAATVLNAPMLNFGAGGNNSIINASYDHMQIYKFTSASDSLVNVQAAMGVPEPAVAILSGSSFFALLRRRRA